MTVPSYAVDCFSFGPSKRTEDVVIIRHGTSDRRPPGREGVNHSVITLCEQTAFRSMGMPFRPSEIEAGEVSGVAVCVPCARRAAVQEAVTASLIADGIPLLHGGR